VTGEHVRPRYGCRASHPGPWLLDNHLVDEILLFIYPVVVGQGMRLFPDTGPDIALDLVDSRAFTNGITMQVYQPTGRPQYAT
jgi:dihydrofolate reductase